MKKKDINLFNKTIHTLKTLMQGLICERDNYHKQIDLLTQQHDIRINQMFKEAEEILGELYELFEDLYNEKTGE